MTMPRNPFLRGYDKFESNRLLLVSRDEESRFRLYRWLHPQQAGLADFQLIGIRCHFGEAFAVVAEHPPLPEDIVQQCSYTGSVLAVVHSITAEQVGTWAHIGNAHSASAAQDVIRQLSFDTGHYSRCWEVSTKHLTPTSLRWLNCCAEGSPPPGVLFQAFHIPGSRGAMGVRLQATPWTDAHLSHVLGPDVDAAYLRQSHELAKMPSNLINVLQLAALADTRLVIFDPDAPVLEGLLLHD
jgi:hypothetical protein